MSGRTYSYAVALIGIVCAYVLVRTVLNVDSLTLRNDLVQGLLTGLGLGVVAVEVLARLKATRVNGWTTIYGAGLPTSGILTRAASARIFPGPVNVPEEAMYWKTRVDARGHPLTGAHDYVLHFPPGGLPPNDAFWSLTIANEKEQFVANPIDRYSVSDRSGLAPNPDGSVDIFLQHAAPQGDRSNWLPAPAGRFVLWLRVYLPGAAILRGEYRVPPVVAAGGR